jgi:hypothetical protein
MSRWIPRQLCRLAPAAHNCDDVRHPYSEFEVHVSNGSPPTGFRMIANESSSKEGTCDCWTWASEQSGRSLLKQMDVRRLNTPVVLGTIE